MKEGKPPKLGQIAKVLRGRDNGKYAIVIGIVDERFCLIADGDKRKFDQPKRKNINHLDLQEEISSEVVNSLQESGRVTNGKLRYAIGKYIESRIPEAGSGDQADAQEKGE